jgi:tetratricopeptide (TPR) repeat protein
VPSCFASDSKILGNDYKRAQEKLTEALKLGGLPIWLEYRAHFELGTTYYHLKDYEKAKHELEKAAEQADADYVRQSDIWKWLEMTCRVLGLQAEADFYAGRLLPSEPMVVMQSQCTVEGADIVMQSSGGSTYFSGNLRHLSSKDVLIFRAR